MRGATGNCDIALHPSKGTVSLTVPVTHRLNNGGTVPGDGAPACILGTYRKKC